MLYLVTCILYNTYEGGSITTIPCRKNVPIPVCFFIFLFLIFQIHFIKKTITDRWSVKIKKHEAARLMKTELVQITFFAQVQMEQSISVWNNATTSAVSKITVHWILREHPYEPIEGHFDRCLQFCEYLSDWLHRNRNLP